MHLFSRLVGTNSLLNLIGVGRAGKQRFSGSNSDVSCKTYKVTVRQRQMVGVAHFSCWTVTEHNCDRSCIEFTTV